MGDAFKSGCRPGLRLSYGVFAAPGVVLLWSLLAIPFLGGGSPGALWLDAAPSLALVAAAAILFLLAVRQP